MVQNTTVLKNIKSILVACHKPLVYVTISLVLGLFLLLGSLLPSRPFPIRQGELQEFSSDFGYVIKTKKKWKVISYYESMSYAHIQDVLLHSNGTDQVITKNIPVGRDEGFQIDVIMNFNPNSGMLNIQYDAKLGDIDDYHIDINTLIHTLGLNAQITGRLFDLDLGFLQNNLIIIPVSGYLSNPKALSNAGESGPLYMLILNNVSGHVSDTGKINVSTMSLTLIVDYFLKR